MTRSRDLANLADGVEFLAADHSKLDGIETAATADQTNAEIRTAVEAASDSNVFTDADHSKLNAIEASATADQTNAEIRAAVEAASDSNVFTDADHSKLNAVEASADVTDTANVTAAGALMDSELTNLAAVKAINQSLVTTASPTFAGLSTTANVGIGDPSPSSLLSISKNSARTNDFENMLKITHSSSNTTVAGFGSAIYFVGERNNGAMQGMGRLIFDAEVNSGTNISSGFSVQTATAGSPSEKFRITHDGNVLVGKQASNSDANGVELLPNGTVYITANNTLPFYINRRGGGTELARFADDGATVGSIGVSSASGGFEIDGGAGYTGLHFATSIIAPKDNGSLNNGGVGLGNSNYRFSDLYLSGGVYLGGTGAANHLDDYEEGTWTPYLARWTGGNISATYTAQNGRYTKIGRMVTLSFDITVSSISSQGSSIAYISGAPFNNSSSQDYDYAGTFGIRTCIPEATIATSCIKHSTNTAIMIRQNNDFDQNIDDNWQSGIMRGSITYEHG